MVPAKTSKNDFTNMADNQEVSYEEIAELLHHRHSSQVIGEGDID